MARRQSRHDKLLILIPVYEDWKALDLLLPLLDRELSTENLRADILIVDDGSSEFHFLTAEQKAFRAIEAIDILPLRRNVGHQRAIAVGLSYLEANQLRYPVVVMDGDGEDNPRDVPRLVKECSAQQDQKIIFAARTRRSECLSFKLFYHLYRVIHFLLTGVQVRVGNFSVIPAGGFRRLVVVSMGMSLVSGGLITVVAIRLLTSLAIPGWATYVTGLLLVILIQMLIVVLVFAFVILAGRDTVSIIPSRDYV